MERLNAAHSPCIPKRQCSPHTVAALPIAMKFSVFPGSGFDKGPLYNRSPSGTAVINSRESELSKQGLIGRNHA